MTRNSRVRFLDRTTPPHIFTLIIMASTSALTMNMYLPSLPKMTEHFGTDYAVMARSVTLFLLGNAVLQLFIGPVADRFGRRPVMIGGLIIFILATIGCLLATSTAMFLTFRMLQAFIVVGMVLSRAVVRDMYTQDQAASMIGYVTMGMAMVPMIAPALGGLLDEWFGWRANFWAFLVFGCATLWLIWSDLAETSTARATSFRDQFRDYPELLTSPRFWGYALTAGLSSGTFFAFVGSAPLIGSDIFGLSPSVLGALFGAPALGYASGNFITGRYAARLGINRMIIIGSLICAGGVAVSLLLFLTGHGTAFTFFGFMCFVGMGNGMALPNAIAGTLSVRPHLAGTASGLGGALMIGGGAALAQLAGEALSVETGVYPLLYIQLVVSLLAVLAIVLVIRRERSLNLA